MNKAIEHLTKDIKNYYKNHMSLNSEIKKEYTDIKKINLKDVNKITSEVYKNVSSIKKINGLASEYFIDIKVESSGEVNTYKRQIKFQIINYK